MKKNYFLLILAFCCLFSVTQKSYGQLSFNSTPVTTATVGASYTYSSFASDGTNNGPMGITVELNYVVNCGRVPNNGTVR